MLNSDTLMSRDPILLDAPFEYAALMANCSMFLISSSTCLSRSLARAKFRYLYQLMELENFYTHLSVLYRHMDMRLH